MSKENVEIVRRIYDAWLGGDPSGFDALDPEIVLYPAAESDWVGLDAAYHGRDGLRRYLRVITEVVDDYHPEIVELIDAGDQVLTLAIESGRGNYSGAPVESRNTAHLWTLHDSKAIRLNLYWDRANALRDLGLAK